MSQVRHFGMFEFKDGITGDQIAHCFDEMRAMVGKIPGLLEVLCGSYDENEEHLNENFTHGFVMSFDSQASRDAYLPHPGARTRQGDRDPLPRECNRIRYRHLRPPTPPFPPLPPVQFRDPSLPHRPPHPPSQPLTSTTTKMKPLRVLLFLTGLRLHPRRLPLRRPRPTASFPSSTAKPSTAGITIPRCGGSKTAPSPAARRPRR